MLVQIKADELKRLKQQVLNYRQTIRNHDKTKKVAQAKELYSDADKLITLEGILLSVVGTQALEPITRKVLASFSDDEFWKKHRHESIEKILTALANK